MNERHEAVRCTQAGSVIVLDCVWLLLASHESSSFPFFKCTCTAGKKILLSGFLLLILRPTTFQILSKVAVERRRGRLLKNVPPP